MTVTPRLALPFLSPGQAQKEFFHNEALQTLDTAVALAVEEQPLSAPPPSPEPGSCYLLTSAPTGAWAGQPRCVAAFTSGGWRFVAPPEGMTAYVKSSATWAVFRSGEWEFGTLRGSALVIGGQQVVGSRAGAIASPAGGATVDSETRSAVDQILAALRLHGLIAT